MTSNLVSILCLIASLSLPLIYTILTGGTASKASLEFQYTIGYAIVILPLTLLASILFGFKFAKSHKIEFILLVLAVAFFCAWMRWTLMGILLGAAVGFIERMRATADEPAAPIQTIFK
jgi:hypothetical protein